MIINNNVFVMHRDVLLCKKEFSTCSYEFLKINAKSAYINIVINYY